MAVPPSFGARNFTPLFAADGDKGGDATMGRRQELTGMEWDVVTGCLSAVDWLGPWQLRYWKRRMNKRYRREWEEADPGGVRGGIGMVGVSLL